MIPKHLCFVVSTKLLKKPNMFARDWGQKRLEDDIRNGFGCGPRTQKKREKTHEAKELTEHESYVSARARCIDYWIGL
jgi:hypothetical protein